MALHVVFTDDGIPGWIGDVPRTGSEPVDRDLMFLATHRRTEKGNWVRRSKPAVQPPTAEEQKTAAEHARAMALQARDEALRQALVTEADPLFFKWQRGEVEKADWLACVAAVKARFPVPSSVEK